MKIKYNQVGKPTNEITDVKESKLKKLTNSMKRNKENILFGLGVLATATTLGYGYSTDKIEKSNEFYKNYTSVGGTNYIHFESGKTIEGNPSKWNLKTEEEYAVYTEKPNFDLIFSDRIFKIEEIK